MSHIDGFINPLKLRIEDLEKAKEALRKANTPQPHYAIIPPETEMSEAQLKLLEYFKQ